MNVEKRIKFALVTSIILLFIAIISTYYELLGKRTVADVLVSIALILNVSVAIDYYKSTKSNKPES